MSGSGPDGMQSMSSADGCGSSAGMPLRHDARGLLRALQRRGPGAGERHSAESLGDRLRLPHAARAQRAVGQAVFGILLLAVAHEVEVARHHGLSGRRDVGRRASRRTRDGVERADGGDRQRTRDEFGGELRARRRW